MKKNLSLIGAVAILLLVSCDKVTNPIVPKETVLGSKFVVNTNTSPDLKKVLLEDFTGQRCKNCPAATDEIHDILLPKYPNSLIVVAVHQGNTFARPYGNFKNDFRTTAGEAWGSSSGGFGVSQWPTGIINRKSDNSGDVIKSAYTSWGSTIPVVLSEPLALSMNVKTEYDTTVRALNIYVKATFKAPYVNKVKLSAMYLEDGLEGLQDVGGVEVEGYKFEHMLRGDINGTWGDDLTSTSTQANDSAKWSKIGFPLPSFKQKLVPDPALADTSGLLINDKNVSVVVFAYDALTKEVLQVEQVKIRPASSSGIKH